MVSCIVKDNGEPKVTQLTFENLFKELKDIPGSELLIKKNWDIDGVRNQFVCFVEADCLVSPGYFKIQLEAFKKVSPRVVLISSRTGVKYWNNHMYGYYLGEPLLVPNRKKKANRLYPVQVAYIPGSFIRTSTLKELIKTLELPNNATEDLVYFSSLISLAIWERGISYDAKHPDGQLGGQVYINPHTTYVTTEDYVNDVADCRFPVADNLLTLFGKESI